VGGRQASGSECGANNGQRYLGVPRLVLGSRRRGYLDADRGSRPSTRHLLDNEILSWQMAIVFGFRRVSGCDDGGSV